MKPFILAVPRARRCFAVLPVLLLGVVLGCRDDEDAPTAPAEAEPAELAAAAALSFHQISAGGSHACGINTNNRAFCWGQNLFGQLGDGTNTDHDRPAAVATTVRFRQLDASDFGVCAVTTDDRVFCWGAIFDPLSSRQPQAVGGSRRFRNVTAGLDHICGVGRDDGRAYCWGGNSFGQLGDGTTSSRTTPTAVAGGRRFRQLAAGERHTCGVTTGDEIFCWGANRWGQLGFESGIFELFLVPRKVAGTHRYVNLTAGRFHTCAVTIASKAFCWGDGRNWQIGDGKNSLRFTPRAVAGGLSFRRLTGGYAHTCGETTDNRAYCWGADLYGAQGDGETDPQFNDFNPRPTAVVGGLRFAQLSAGRHFTCGKTTADVGYCWGDNGGGQLGDGSGTNQSRPTPCAGPS
jgi:alpha-tubulin suppressor-like RCC1 family protein